MKYLFSFTWAIQIVILLVLFFLEDISYSDTSLTILLATAFCNTILFFIYKKGVRKTKKSGLWSLIFLLGYLIVFFQFYVDLIIGNLDINDSVFANSNTIIGGCIISLCGLLSFFWGYTIKTTKRTRIFKEERQIKIPNTALLKFLLVISLILFVIYNYKMILLGGYSQEMLEAQAGTMGLYSNMLFQIVLFLYVSYKSQAFQYVDKYNFKYYIKHLGPIFNICILLYTIFILMSGDRGPVIVICLAYYGGYLLSSKNDIKYIRLIGVIGLSAFVITILGDVRKQDSNMAYWDKVKESVNATSTKEESFSPYTEELAGSVKTLHYAIDYVPEKHPYLYGSFQIRQLCSAIPFMNHVVYTVADPHFKYKGSDFFITWIIQGDKYTYGSGSSCNADLYLSFGIIGVVIGLLLWGVIYRKIEDLVDYSKNSHAQSIILLFFLAYSLYVNRSYMLCFINYMTFTFILKILYENFIRKEQVTTIIKKV